jgi:hypothetical protein
MFHACLLGKSSASVLTILVRQKSSADAGSNRARHKNAAIIKKTADKFWERIFTPEFEVQHDKLSLQI